MLKLFLLRKGFKEYYGTDPAKEYLKVTERINPNEVSIYVSSSSFIEIYHSDNGGAISVDSTSTNQSVLIDNTLFFICSSTKNGGSMFFNNPGSFIINKVCSHGSECDGNGKFTSIQVSNDSTQRNWVCESTVCYSLKDNRCTGMLYHYYGSLLAKSDNFSFNKCAKYSGLYFYSTSSTSNNITYSTFLSNNATMHTCICLNNDKASKNIENSNIINNNQKDSGYGLIYAIGNILLRETSFISNDAKYIIYQGLQSSSVTIDNCSSDENLSTRAYGNLVIRNEPSNSFTNVLEHFSTANCNEIPDDLKIPIIPTKENNNSKKRVTNIVVISISSLVAILVIVLIIYIVIHKKKESKELHESEEATEVGKTFV